jgi:hypothetical protein
MSVSTAFYMMLAPVLTLLNYDTALPKFLASSPSLFFQQFSGQHLVAFSHPHSTIK